MNIARIFAHAFVRRLAFVAAALVLAWCGIGRAHASTNHATQPEAYAACMASGAAAPASTGSTEKGGYSCSHTVLGPPGDPLHAGKYNCTATYTYVSSGNAVQVQCAFYGPSGNDAEHYYTSACPGSSVFNESTGECDVPCNQRPPLSGGTIVVPSLDQSGWPVSVCKNACTYTAPMSPTQTYWQIDGQVYLSVQGWEPLGGTCTVDNDWQEPPPDRDNDGVSDAEDDFPDDPNESTDSDGDGTGDNNDHSPDDDTDGADTPGEEDGDDEGDNVAHGGGDCTAPPQCSGDGIACAQLHTQWKIMCKGATVTGVPEMCNLAYDCRGDSAQCVQIALLRKTACGVEGLEAGLGEGGNGSGGDAAQELVNGLKNGPPENGDLAENPMGIWGEPEEIEADSAGFGLGRSCPPMPAIFGRAIDTAPLCTLGGVIAALILLAGFIQFGYAFTQS